MHVSLPLEEQTPLLNSPLHEVHCILFAPLKNAPLHEVRFILFPL